MRIIGVGLAALLATAALAQQQPKRFTLTANAQCASVDVQSNSTVGIILSGTWSGTLTPTLLIAGVSGAPTAATTVTPTNSSTGQATITANGGYKTSVGGFTRFNLCFTSFSSGSAVIDLFSTQAVNASLLGGAGGGVTGTGLTSGNVVIGAGGSAVQDSGTPAANLLTTDSTIQSSKGGTNADSSAATGFATVNSGAWGFTKAVPTGAVVGSSDSQTLTNKVLNGASSGNSVTQLNFQYGTATLTGNSSAQVVFTYTLPANTLAAGKGIRIHARMLQSGSTSTTYGINFGGTAAVSYATTVAANNILVADIFNQPGLTNAQVALPLFAGSTGGIVALTALNDPAVDTTSNVTITLTFNVANTVTLTKYAWTVELIQ